MAPALDMESTHTESQIKSENKQSAKVLEELMSKLSVSKTGDEAKGFSQEIATFINGDIEEKDAPTKAVESLKKMLNNKKRCQHTPARM